jgi:hypothetical protein
MKEQYAGDINDYRKFAILRRLRDDGRTRIGVCWMLTPPDGRNDGARTQFLQQPDVWRRYDPELHDKLNALVSYNGVDRTKFLEKSGILGGAEFFSEFVPTSPNIRAAYMCEALERLRRCQLVFFDPDNGLHVSSVAIGAATSPKYVYRSEVLAAYERGHSILIYQHFPREDHKSFISRATEELCRLCRRSQVWCFETADVAFLLVVHSAHQEIIGTIAANITADWDAAFVVAHGPTTIA